MNCNIESALYAHMLQMARMLAAKTSLMSRKDALGEDEGEADSELGIDVRAKLEQRLKIMEEGSVRYHAILIYCRLLAFQQF